MAVSTGASLHRFVRRLASFMLTWVVASVIVFLLLNLLPGDVAGVILGPNATPESVQALRESLGLNRPLYLRYLEWVSGLFSGELGYSALSGQSVTPLIVAKLATTTWLIVVGMVLALAIAIPVGIYAALHRHHADGLMVSALSQFGMSVPAFVVGIALSIGVGVKLRWLPANEYIPITRSFTGWLSHIILPALTLALVQSAILIRYVRSAFIEVLQQDYYRTARAIGWRRWPALVRHGMRNAALQIITILGLQLATLFTGAIVVESVFVLQGLGQYLVQSVTNRDLPVVQTVVMVLVTIVLVINLIVDTSYLLIDPRLRSADEEQQ